MRNLNRGQSLTRNEILELKSKLKFSKHFIKRMSEREGSMEELNKTFDNPYICFYNTDYSINLCPDNNRCYVIERDKDGHYILVTYKHNTKSNMTRKQMLATLGIERRK